MLLKTEIKANADLKQTKLKIIKTEDLDISGLTDISGLQINTRQPVQKRLADYLSAVGNPYFFMIKDTPVRVSFSSSAPALEECLAKIFEQTDAVY